MSESHAIMVRVNDDLTLDAGCWQEVPAGDGDLKRIIHPPHRTMFDQLLDYLSAALEPLDGPSPSLVEEALAATAVCVRWGTYVAVLADQDLPLMDNVRDERLSRISDSEMARINVEASSGLERWIELLRDDLEQYRALVRVACSLLMPQLQAQRSCDGDQLLMLTDPRFVAAVATRLGTETGRRARQNAEAHPTRMLANSLIHVAWRNGPVEAIHAGRHSSYPLTRRRLAAAEDRAVTSTTAGRLEYGLRAVHDLLGENSERTWAEKVVPCGVATFLAPYRWSLIEQTRIVDLDGKEVLVDRASL